MTSGDKEGMEGVLNPHRINLTMVVSDLFSGYGGNIFTLAHHLTSDIDLVVWVDKIWCSLRWLITHIKEKSLLIEE